ncbi:MAG: ABC transporter permease [Solirubrobacterales bacterium]
MTNPTSQVQSAGTPESAQLPPSSMRRRKKPLRHYLEAYSFLALLVLAAAFFSIWSETSETFTSAANIRTLIGSNAVIAIVAIAALVPLVCYEFDLSVGAIAGLSSIYVATVLASGLSVPLAIGLGIVLGLVIGLFNALLITRIGVNAVITTLGMSIIVDGVINQKSGGIAITGDIPLGFSQFGSSTWFGIPKIAFILALIALAVYYLLEHTPYGRYLYAFGSNRDAARLVGVRTKLTLGLTFLISGALSGAAGVLQVSRAGSADPKVGDTFTLPALAAAFLSAAAMKPGRYNVAGTLVAIFFLGVLNNGLNLAGSPEYVSNYVNGAALIVGVALAVRLGRRQEE